MVSYAGAPADAGAASKPTALSPGARTFPVEFHEPSGGLLRIVVHVLPTPVVHLSPDAYPGRESVMAQP